MFGKILRAVILIPLAVLLIAFAVANRQVVVVSLDPFEAEVRRLRMELEAQRSRDGRDLQDYGAAQRRESAPAPRTPPLTIPPPAA